MNPCCTNRIAGWVLACGMALTLSGCAASNNGDPPPDPRSANINIHHLKLFDLVAPAPTEDPIALSAAKNECASFTLHIGGLPELSAKSGYTLRVGRLKHVEKDQSISTDSFNAYQILSMPIDVNRAGYVRHTGSSASTRSLPRALLPMPMVEGALELDAARDPEQPLDKESRAGGKEPVLLWIDLQIPPQAPAGEYEGSIDLVQAGYKKPLASLPIRVNVYDFVLPDERHLMMIGQIEWNSLLQLFPDRFEAISDRLLNRNDPRYSPAIKTLDQLVKLAQSHRTQVVIPRLQPTVKWPGGRPPQVMWNDYDSVVAPWLTGEMFADRVPLGFWPLPAVNGLLNYDRKSQTDYWSEAASHFDQHEWLWRSAVVLEKPTPGRATAMENVSLSADAASILAGHPRIHVAVPLEDDQVQFASPANPRLIDPSTSLRLITSNPGIVFSSPMKNWPAGVRRPPRWLRTDLTGLIPYVGAGGDERDVRLWAWLAFVPLPPPSLGVEYGPVQFIRWGSVLPRNSQAPEPADPNELIWFYPGGWFGVDEPLPTVQLKWLRRAQQDFEYLYLARQRGDRLNALLMARLITKPVEIQPKQPSDPTFGLMSGTSDPKAWNEAIELLAQRILLREPGQSVDKQRDFALNRRIQQWAAPQEREVLIGRTAGWNWDSSEIDLKLGIDIYNASDSRPDENTLEWSAPLPSGWEIRPQPMPVPSLGTYHVERVSMRGRIDPSRVRNSEREPVQVRFTNGFTNKSSTLRMMLPVAISDRREGKIQFDGALSDWSADDAILDGPMVRMLSRPAVQAQELQLASTKSSIYTSWADENFYVAFKVTGMNQTNAKTFRNFANYQFRRVWGEDACQIIIQPVYADNSLGPLMHLVCTPRGSLRVERKMDPKMFPDPWQPIEGADVRYVANNDGSDWRGELSVPWKAINQPGKSLPVMLRFNFSQHRDTDGESASWAGPVDFGRDEAFTGILYLREPDTPGVARN